VLTYGHIHVLYVPGMEWFASSSSTSGHQPLKNSPALWRARAGLFPSKVISPLPHTRESVPRRRREADSIGGLWQVQRKVRVLVGAGRGRGVASGRCRDPARPEGRWQVSKLLTRRRQGGSNVVRAQRRRRLSRLSSAGNCCG
jgi:hypothetical protein